MKKRGKNYSREISINNFFTLSSKRRLYPKGHINTPLHPLYFGTHIRRRTLSLITLSYLESAYLCSKTAPSNTVDLTPRNTKSNALRPGKSFEGRANCSKLSTLSAIVFIGGQLLLDGSNPRNLDVSRMTSALSHNAFHGHNSRVYDRSTRFSTSFILLCIGVFPYFLPIFFLIISPLYFAFRFLTKRKRIELSIIYD